MGININQTVNVRGGGGSDAALFGLGLVAFALMGGGGVTIALGAITALLIWVLGTVVALIVLAIVLLIVFRKRLGGPGVVRIGEASLLRDPERDMPKPKEVIHRHYHVIDGPRRDMPSLADLVEREIVEAEILP